MNIFAFILMVVAAVVFLAGDPLWSRYQRSAVSVGLAFLTIGFIVQFCTTSHTITF